MGVRVLLIGNGSHDNRGCQAIDLSTLLVLQAAFGEVDAVVMQHTPGPVSFRSVPDGVRVTVGEPTGSYARFSKRWAQRQFARALGPARRVALYEGWFDTVRKAAATADAVLAVGGDNLTLDYGPPDLFWALDRSALAATPNVFVWGASIGPFGEDPLYERFAADELSRLAGVFARESITAEYLASLGMRAPVHRVADSAFVLEPADVTEERLGFVVPEGAVGVNLSPLLARYRGESPAGWVESAADMVGRLAGELGRPLVLVPHVIAPGNDDHDFLSAVRARLDGAVAVRVAPRDLDAAELKGVIAGLACFAGARTHATIAALSSGVPTVSIAYSTKARGLNRELFGDERWVLDARKLDGASLGSAIGSCLEQSHSVREALAPRVERARTDAYRAGTLLREALEGRRP